MKVTRKNKYPIILAVIAVAAIVVATSGLGKPKEAAVMPVQGVEIAQRENLIASFSTTLNPDQLTRNHNVRLACEALDGVVILPGEEFSFNDRVGPRVGENGYLEARAILYGKSEPSLGGGICQVSTTLYNVALMAGFEITDRMHHSTPAPYVLKGMDAMVSWGMSDLKFVNDSQVPIQLFAQADDNRILMMAKIYGDEKDFFFDWEAIEMTSKLIEVVDPKPKSTPDLSKKASDPPNLNAGKIVSSGTPGYKVEVWRLWNMKDGTRVNELISSDFYEPVDFVVE